MIIVTGGQPITAIFISPSEIQDEPGILMSEGVSICM